MAGRNLLFDSFRIVSMIAWLGLVWSSVSLVASECPPNVLAMYQTILHTEWSEENFPKQYPEWRPPAQWSVVVGRTHNSSGVLWKLGATASDAVRLFVETGRVDLLVKEHPKKGILSEFFAPPLLQGVGTTQATLFVDDIHSKVSMICRITPSPDWFIGVDSLELCRDKKWVDHVTLDLDPTDGGTDNGYTFTSPKWATVPRSKISSIQSRYPDHPASSFFYPKLDQLPRIAYVQFKKLKEFSLTKEMVFHFEEDNQVLDTNNTYVKHNFSYSPMSELRKYSKKERRYRKDKSKKLFESEISDYTAKKEATIQKKGLDALKKRYRMKSCRVSEWTDWGGCSTSCGFGEQFRRRKINHFGSRKSRPCPPLEESRWCRSQETCHNKTTSTLFRWR